MFRLGGSARPGYSTGTENPATKEIEKLIGERAAEREKFMNFQRSTLPFQVLAGQPGLSTIRKLSDIPTLLSDIGRDPALFDALIKGRSLDSLPAIRDFLGEYSGGSKVIPGKANVNRQRTVAEQKEGIERRVVETIDRMSKTLFKKDYFDNLVKHNDTLKADNKFIFDEQPLGTGPNQYQQIGMALLQI